MISYAKYASDGTVTAGPIAGTDMSGITEASRFWAEIKAWIDAGHAITPYAPPPVPVPESVSARQFKLQLYTQGLLDQVEAWIEQQDRPVRIAYDNSGSFVRSSPMMAAGFAALGFADPEIDAFFIAAAAL